MPEPKSYPIDQFRNRISDILGRVQYAKESITITRRGVVIAKVVPVEPESLTANPLERLGETK